MTRGSTAPDRSTPRAPAATTCSPVELLEVSGTPAYDGTAVTELTPGTISKAMPARAQAEASSARPLKTAGSPSMRRTTRPPACALAARTTSLAREAWVRFSPWSPWPGVDDVDVVAAPPLDDGLASHLVDDDGVGGREQLGRRAR